MLSVQREGLRVSSVHLLQLAALPLPSPLALTLPPLLHNPPQLPQIVFIAAAETMVAVPGLAFAFSEAGPHMGSLLQAVWALMQLGQLLTGAIALGNVKP